MADRVMPNRGTERRQQNLPAAKVVDPQSVFDRLMSKHHVSGRSFFEFPTEEIISVFKESIWMNNLQPKREMEMIAFRTYGSKLFRLSPDGTISSFDILSGEVCWSIPSDITLIFNESSGNNCSYFVDSSRVFMHTNETKPSYHSFHSSEVFGTPLIYLDEDIFPSKSMAQIYVDPVEGRRITPSTSECDEILCVRAIHAQVTSFEPGTDDDVVLWYERVATFDMWIVGREEGVRLQQQHEQHIESRNFGVNLNHVPHPPEVITYEIIPNVPQYVKQLNSDLCIM